MGPSVLGWSRATDSAPGVLAASNRSRHGDTDGSTATARCPARRGLGVARSPGQHAPRSVAPPTCMWSTGVYVRARESDCSPVPRAIGRPGRESRRAFASRADCCSPAPQARSADAREWENGRDNARADLTEPLAAQGLRELVVERDPQTHAVIVTARYLADEE